MQLRKYQQDLIDNIKSAMRSGRRSICAVLGCGGGKSVIAANIAKMTTDNHNQVLFIVHRKELCEQIAQTFISCGVDMFRCKIEMVQTAVRRLQCYNPALIITDEAHHCLAGSYRRIYNAYPQAYKIGFTATPMRAGNQGLGKVFDCLIESVSTKWLIENKFLAPYRCFGIRLADTSSLHIKHGEFDNKESESLMSSKLIYGETIKNYKAYCDGKQTIVYCSGVKNSQATAAEFNSAGITAKHLDGTTPMFERKQAIQDFRDGKIKVLCNVDLFGEGFDVPDCECVILLRPTASLTLHIQQSMRSMRYKPGKTAIIIDHVCNTHIHGLPDDEREWSLEGKSKIKKVVKKTVKDCPECFAVLPISEKICKHCGYNFGETDTEKETETVDIILEEIVSADILRGKPYDSYRDCGTFDELERFRKAKGYKFAWSVFKAAELNILPVKYYNLARRMGVMYA